MSAAPRRIQRLRTKGWRMPEGVVYVGRPGRWGNPFWHVQKFHGRDRALELYRQLAQGCWSPAVVADWPEHYAAQIYEEHCAWLKRLGGRPFEEACAELRGRDLACWCPRTAPCHADILLEVANR